MAWQALHIQTTKEYADSISEWLEEMGALAVTLQDAADQPVFEPAPGETPLWEQMVITGLFEESYDISAVISAVPTTVLNHQQETIEDQNWQAVCMQDFKPMQFGQRLWICPSWETLDDPDACIVKLDPGLAFGTGTHPTTSMCLAWLDQHIKGGETLIDYGCGSGILAIAAIKLGATKVYAVDNDPQALEATINNRDENRLTAEQVIPLMNDETIPESADIVIANILAGPLAMLAPTLTSLVKTDGQITLSGILEDQAESLISAYEQKIAFSEKNQQDGWILLSFN